ncbi:HESP055 [Hemileuca sp. nucleopolyhedrovirus]|uniref:HESP055 n=1 Tax=Hemileuca sp. nucleopolyhedrovirus TaxID=1367203 RepID=S5N988_9ABAC|nr:HESP055 [Hemileuca sp. nucleopolyhedrovirus]AGR56807.1 HESP055 [Hemileuca sp. nucleopolyhedrovirus]
MKFYEILFFVFAILVGILIYFNRLFIDTEGVDYYGYRYPDNLDKTFGSVTNYLANNVCPFSNKNYFNSPIDTKFRCSQYLNCRNLNNLIFCLPDTYFSFDKQKCVEWRQSDCFKNGEPEIEY